MANYINEKQVDISNGKISITADGDDANKFYISPIKSFKDKDGNEVVFRPKNSQMVLTKQELKALCNSLIEAVKNA